MTYPVRFVSGRYLCILSILILLFYRPLAAQDDPDMYWVSYRGVFKMEAKTGERRAVIAETVNDPGDLAFDPVEQKIYWIDRATLKIQRANLEGTGIEDVILDDLDDPGNLTLDPVGRKLYWWDAEPGQFARANLDGTEVETLPTALPEIAAASAVDTSTRHIYHISFNQIFRTNLDGSDAQEIIPSLSGVLEDLALDLIHGKVYWTDASRRVIQRANLDGSGVEDIVTTSLSAPKSLSVDPMEGALYWIDGDRIRRSRLDLVEVEDVLTDVPAPRDLLLQPGLDRLYWSVEGRIQRATRQGADVKDLVRSRLDSPQYLAIDSSAEKMYWAGNSTIQRSDIDGDRLETLYASENERITGFTLDEANKQIYWVARSDAPFIKRARLDGSGVEELLPLDVTRQPTSIALDSLQHILYQADLDRISRTGLDGSSMSGSQILVSSIQFAPFSITLDLDGGALYWSDIFFSSILRTDLENLDTQEVVSVGAEALTGITVALDGDAQELYWSVADEHRIQRARLDGSEIEEVLTVFGPRGMAFHRPEVKEPEEKEPESTIANEDAEVIDPHSFFEANSYPNPFHRFAKIQYSIAAPQQVSAVVYDLQGRQVTTLMNTYHATGTFEIHWNGNDALGRSAPPGVYLLRLSGSSGIHQSLPIVKMPQ